MRLLISTLGICAAFMLLTPSTNLMAEQAQPDSSYVIEEIVVTSRRRTETVQDVPLSVTAFGERELERLAPATLRDLDTMAPNVYIGMNTAGPGASAIYIRGIGYADIEKSQSPQVGVIVDGLQLGSSTGQLVDMTDVESVEINRGPQGVLFGRNTIGGNIVINRVRPQFNEFGFKASAELANYASRLLRARVNIPILDDQLALKLSAYDRERDGFYSNDTIGGSAGDIEVSGQTVSLRWAPSENLDAVLTYDHIKDRGQIPPQDPRFDGDNPHQNLADKREPVVYDVDQWGLRIDWDIGDINVRSITGHHFGHDLVNQDFDGGSISGAAIPFAQLHTLRNQEFEIFSQEVLVSGDINEDLSFLVGLYYFDHELEFRQDTNNVLQLPPIAVTTGPLGLPFAVASTLTTCASINGFLEAVAGIPGGLGLRANPGLGDVLCQFPNARSTQYAGEQAESLAFFGALTWTPTPQLEFTLGLRNIDEEKDAFNSYFDYTTGTFDTGSTSQEHDFSAIPGRAGNSSMGGDSWGDTIFTASASYAFADTSRAYLSYNEGYRSGGFSIRSARSAAEAAFEPEEALQWEAGIKNEFLNGRLTANLAYYNLETEGGQFSSIITLPPGSIPGTTTLINNGDASEYSGIEFELAYLVTDELSLFATAGWLDVENKAFTIACELLDGCTAGGVLGADPPGTLRTVGGNSDSRSPDRTWSLAAAYDTQLGIGQLSAYVGYKYTGDLLLVNTGGGADQRLYGGDYGLIDARLSWEMPIDDDLLTVSVYGKNLGDEEYREQALFLGGFQTGFQGWGAPRTYALEIRYSH